MKILIAAVIASAVSFGAFAQTTPAMGASAPMAKPMTSSGMTKDAPVHKTTKTHAPKHAKKASAPAA